LRRAALLVACSAWYLWTNVVKVVPDLPKPSDLSFHLEAAKALLRGQTPYVNIDYDYPPLAAFLAVPLTLLDYLTARFIWLALSNCCLLAAAFLIWRLLGKGPAALCVVSLVWAFGGVARENLGLGQLGPLLVLLLAIAYTQKSPLGGFAAGFGFGLKFIPGVLGLPLVLGRRWKQIAGALAGAFVALALPWAALFAFSGPKSPPRADYWMGTPATLSWSVPSALLRVLDPATQGPMLPHNWAVGARTSNIHLSTRDRSVSVFTAAAILLIGAVLVFTANPHPSEQRLPFAMAGLISLALAASPISWAHYQVLQYPGTAILLYEFFRRKAWAVLSLATLGALSTYQIPVAALTDYYQRWGGWTAESPATLYIWTNVTPAACLLLFGLHMHAYRAASEQ
jgi:hypothetical protein